MRSWMLQYFTLPSWSLFVVKTYVWVYMFDSNIYMFSWFNLLLFGMIFIFHLQRKQFLFRPATRTVNSLCDCPGKELHTYFLMSIYGSSFRLVTSLFRMGNPPLLMVNSPCSNAPCLLNLHLWSSSCYVERYIIWFWLLHHYLWNHHVHSWMKGKCTRSCRKCS